MTRILAPGPTAESKGRERECAKCTEGTEGGKEGVSYRLVRYIDPSDPLSCRGCDVTAGHRGYEMLPPLPSSLPNTHCLCMLLARRLPLTILLEATTNYKATPTLLDY